MSRKSQKLFCIFFPLQDVDKDYNPKELARSLLGQYPKLLKQEIVIEPPKDGSSIIIIIFNQAYINMLTI